MSVKNIYIYIYTLIILIILIIIYTNYNDCKIHIYNSCLQNMSILGRNKMKTQQILPEI